jgi:two-component system NarL family response regulator
MQLKPSISVLIVDDHVVVREGLKAIISSEPDLEVVGEAGTGAEAIKAYTLLRPRVVLMDLMLPDCKGSDVIAQICSKHPDAQIVVLTTLGGDEEIYRALDAGARGYLLKDMVRKALITAINEVAAKRRYIPPEVGTKLAENFPRQRLTAREIEVLRQIATGMRNKEVAFALGISEETVNAHVKHILSKLNVPDRTQAVVVSLRRGIIHL